MLYQQVNLLGIAFALRYLYDEKDPNNLVSAAWNTVPKFTETKTNETNEPKHQWSYSEDAKLPGFDLNPVKQERKNKNRKKIRK